MWRIPQLHLVAVSSGHHALTQAHRTRRQQDILWAVHCPGFGRASVVANSLTQITATNQTNRQQRRDTHIYPTNKHISACEHVQGLLLFRVARACTLQPDQQDKTNRGTMYYCTIDGNLLAECCTASVHVQGKRPRMMVWNTPPNTLCRFVESTIVPCIADKAHVLLCFSVKVCCCVLAAYPGCSD